MEKRPTFTDYLSVLFKWKKLLIISLVIIGIITTGITFLIQEKFKADAVIMIQEDDNMGLLGNVMSSAGSLLGGALFGSGSTSMDKIFGYLESRRILLNVIEKFNLVQYYDFTNYKTEKTLKALKDDAKFDLTQNGFIEISMIHESPDTAKQIVNYFIEVLDSLNSALTSAHATSYRKFIEKRYFKNRSDMKDAELQFKSFQEQYKVYVIPEQLESAFKILAQLEGELAQKELESEIIKMSQGATSSAALMANKHIEILKQKLNNITSGKSTTNESLIALSFKDLPKIQMEYLRLFREIEIQTKLLEFTLPLYEQAVMEEQKDVPTIIVLDKPFVPELKDSPKKAFIIVAVELLFFFILLFLILRAELLFNKTEKLNLIEQKELNFYSGLKETFRI